MVYALVYAENTDIVAPINLAEEAERELVAFVSEHPAVRDDIGPRPYDDGLPVGEFLPASALLAEAPGAAQRA